MKFLIDMPLSPRLVEPLTAAGHDAAHLSRLGLHKLSDAEIMFKAAQEHRVVLTADYDFTTILAVLGATSPSVVIIQSRALPLFTRSPERLLEALTEVEDALRKGAIVLFEPGRYRFRLLPIGS